MARSAVFSLLGELLSVSSTGTIFDPCRSADVRARTENIVDPFYYECETFADAIALYTYAVNSRAVHVCPSPDSPFDVPLSEFQEWLAM